MMGPFGNERDVGERKNESLPCVQSRHLVGPPAPPRLMFAHVFRIDIVFGLYGSFVLPFSSSSGCYWGTEKFVVKDFQKLFPNSIQTATVGFMSPDPNAIKNPSYRQVCSGTTGHVEVLYVELTDPKAHYEGTITSHMEACSSDFLPLFFRVLLFLGCSLQLLLHLAFNVI